MGQIEQIDSGKIAEFLKKVETLKKAGRVDLSAAEDASVAVMNLISLEEHFFFTASKTGDASYHDISKDIRAMRTRVMEGLVDKYEGETWCATKHLLSASMRLIEVGNRYNAAGEKEKMKQSFADAYRLYSIFWALKAKLVSVAKTVEVGKESVEKKWSLEDLVAKLADCCDEK